MEQFKRHGWCGGQAFPPLVFDPKLRLPIKVGQRRKAQNPRAGCLTKKPATHSSGFLTNNSKPLLAIWAESFLFTGSTAFLLLVANLFPVYWYFSFFALTPFLYRIINASPGESLRLGFLFGLSFFSVSLTDSLIVSPFPSILKLLCGIGLFALFGWTIGRARQKWGFYPSIVAVLWIGLEFGLVKLGLVGGSALGTTLSLSKGGLFGVTQLSQPLLHGLVGLLGFLTVSAIIVLLNSLLVLAIIETLKLTRPKGKTIQEEGKWELSFISYLFAEKVYLVPEGRAPPFVCCDTSRIGIFEAKYIGIC